MGCVRLWRRQWARNAFPDEPSAVEFVRAIRWPNGATCPDCGSREIRLDLSEKMRCRSCAKRFNARAATVFARSKLGLRQWLIAVRLITSHPRSITSTQLARDLGVTQDTAWHILRRLARFLGKTSIRFSDEEKILLVERLVQARFEMPDERTEG